MMDDPYDVLGVRRGDSDAAIRKAYRNLAKRHHPDLNPGKPEAAERFKAINAANDLLSDPERRGRFDRGEIDAAGNETTPAPPPRGPRDPGRGPTRDTGRDSPFEGMQGLNPEDLEALFGGAFSDRFGGGAGFNARGGDAQYGLTVDFLDAANGAVRRLALPGGRVLDVKIPAGLRDGHVLRLKGQGRPGLGDAPAGDALVEVSVAPHPLFRRDGDDVLMEMPVTLREAVLGATLEVPTIAGPVRLAIPPNSANGAKLRLARRGIAGGHQIVTLRLVLPVQPDPALTAFLESWEPAAPIDPRAAMEPPT